MTAACAFSSFAHPLTTHRATVTDHAANDVLELLVENLCAVVTHTLLLLGKRQRDGVDVAFTALLVSNRGD